MYSYVSFNDFLKATMKYIKEDNIDDYLKDLYIDPCAKDISLDFSITHLINVACKYVEENSIEDYLNKLRIETSMLDAEDIESVLANDKAPLSFKKECFDTLKDDYWHYIITDLINEGEIQFNDNNYSLTLDDLTNFHNGLSIDSIPDFYMTTLTNKLTEYCENTTDENIIEKILKKLVNWCYCNNPFEDGMINIDQIQSDKNLLTKETIRKLFDLYATKNNWYFSASGPDLYANSYENIGICIFMDHPYHHGPYITKAEFIKYFSDSVWAEDVDFEEALEKIQNYLNNIEENTRLNEYQIGKIFVDIGAFYKLS